MRSIFAATDPLSRLRERVRVRAILRCGIEAAPVVVSLEEQAPAAPTPHPSLLPQGEKGRVLREWKGASLRDVRQGHEP